MIGPLRIKKINKAIEGIKKELDVDTETAIKIIEISQRNTINVNLNTIAHFVEEIRYKEVR